MHIFFYSFIIFILAFKIYSVDLDKKDQNIENILDDQDNFKKSKTNNEIFNRIYSKLFVKTDLCLLNSSYFAETKNLSKYSSLKLDKPLIGKYLSFNNFIGYKIKQDQVIGLRYGMPGFAAGNLVQHDFMLALSYNRLLFSKKFFSIEGEIGIGFYLSQTKNEKLKKIIDVVKSNDMEVFTEKIFLNIIFTFYWNFIGISIGGPIALKFLGPKQDLEDKIEKLINLLSLELSDTNKNKKDEYNYIKSKINSDFISLLDFLNIRLSLDIMDLTKFILQKTQK